MSLVGCDGESHLAIDTDQRDALLTLMLTPGLGQTLIGRCIDTFGNAEAVLNADINALARINRISHDMARTARREFANIRTEGRLERERELIERFNVHLLTRDNADYPRLLHLIPDPPVMLYVRGEIRAEDALALAMVGSRRCSAYGREQADRFAAGCVQAGLCIISGGAIGIDGAAHRAALRVGGRTIAVIGNGLSDPYPARHQDLFEAIIADRGAVISELPMSAPPAPENFPRRNRLISGLALGVLVIEAARRSGALITARLCVEDHGRECMALPGRVDAKTSGGCHELIRSGGAALVTSPAEVIEALGEAGQCLQAPAPEHNAEQEAPPRLLGQNLTDSQTKILAQLDRPHDLDHLAGVTGLAVPVVQADLTMLQVRGLVSRRSGRFVRQR